jgi:hypothetical protein
VNWLDIGRQHFAAFGNVNGRVSLCAKVLAHVSSMRAISEGNSGSVSGRRERAARRRVPQQVRVYGGVNNGCRGAALGRVQKGPARVHVQPTAGRGGDGMPHRQDTPNTKPSDAILPEAVHLLVYVRVVLLRKHFPAIGQWRFVLWARKTHRSDCTEKAHAARRPTYPATDRRIKIPRRVQMAVLQQTARKSSQRSPFPQRRCVF